MSRTTNQIETPKTPVTPKLIKPPMRSSYEAIEDSSNESSSSTRTSKQKSKKQLIASADLSISNAKSPSEMVDNGAVTSIFINIDFTDILETPASTTIPKPEKLDDPIKDLMRLIKKDLKARRKACKARATRRSQQRSTTPNSTSTSKTTSNFTSFEATDEYQNLGMVKRGIRQQLPEGPSTIAAEHVSSIPDNQLTPKKFLLGKKRREYVVLGDLNKSD